MQMKLPSFRHRRQDWTSGSGMQIIHLLNDSVQWTAFPRWEQKMTKTWSSLEGASQSCHSNRIAWPANFSCSHFQLFYWIISIVIVACRIWRIIDDSILIAISFHRVETIRIAYGSCVYTLYNMQIPINCEMKLDRFLDTGYNDQRNWIAIAHSDVWRAVDWWKIILSQHNFTIYFRNIHVNFSFKFSSAPTPHFIANYFYSLFRFIHCIHCRCILYCLWKQIAWIRW